LPHSSIVPYPTGSSVSKHPCFRDASNESVIFEYNLSYRNLWCARGATINDDEVAISSA
jgi:hypothetical protein